ncbi:MAG: hypothetical protein KGL39_57390 [Patescibacteria group bacterium]|nr:hypothetical protein [Patescibacteria group bacterium]
MKPVLILITATYWARYVGAERTALFAVDQERMDEEVNMLALVEDLRRGEGNDVD